MTSETIPGYSEKVNSINSSIRIEVIVVKLRISIDQLGIHFDKAKNLISELARELDEAKQYKQSQICRKIKDLLEDKIKEGKISEKWIEECLPQEYKRKYVKSEVSSLSKQGKKDNTTTGQQKENGLIAIEPSIKTDATLASNYGGEGGAESEFKDKCEAALLLKKQEIEQVLIRQRSLVNDDETSTNEIRLAIPKEKFENVKAAMENSRDFVYLIFDKSGRLERAESDVLTETKK
jgi:hypothetical protein